MKACYANSYRMLKRHGTAHDLTYVEGWSLWGSAVFAHAWCVDRDDGVLDRTLNCEAYCGVPFARRYVVSVIEARRRAGDLYFGLIDDWEAGWPLLRELADRPERWRARAVRR